MNQSVQTTPHQKTGGPSWRNLIMIRNYKLLIAALLVSRLLLPAAQADDMPPQPATAAVTKPEKGPPLPLHTIDGVGGVVITPIAYLVNPGPEKHVFGLPSVSGTYVGAGQKNIQSFVITETLWRRLELGYSASRFGIGNLPTQVQTATSVDINRSDVWLHTLNARALAIPENSFGLPFPAITLGLQGKFNDGISEIDQRLGGALTGIGLRHSVGVDFVGTATKLFAKGFGRPLILTAGLRASAADQLGYVGFGDAYRPSFEVNAVYLIRDNIGLAFEYRQKRNAFNNIGTLVRKEDDWFTAGAAYVFNNHSSVTAGYGHFGNVLNTVENYGWALSAKYEF